LEVGEQFARGDAVASGEIGPGHLALAGGLDLEHTEAGALPAGDEAERGVDESARRM
jgi:hypothetical protein